MQALFVVAPFVLPVHVVSRRLLLAHNGGIVVHQRTHPVVSVEKKRAVLSVKHPRDGKKKKFARRIMTTFNVARACMWTVWSVWSIRRWSIVHCPHGWRKYVSFFHSPHHINASNPQLPDDPSSLGGGFFFLFAFFGGHLKQDLKINKIEKRLVLIILVIVFTHQRKIKKYMYV